MTKEEAIEFYNSGKWKTMSDKEIVDFQLYEEKLCMPFGRFHEAIEKILNRPVFTHEFASGNLKKEYEGKISSVKSQEGSFQHMKDKLGTTTNKD